MESFHFFLKHTPFWAIPLLMISGEFAYIYWLRDRKTAAKLFFLLVLFSLGFLMYYFVSGGPKGSVQSFIMFWQESGEYGESLLKP